MIKKNIQFSCSFAFDSICVNTSVDCVWLNAYANVSISPVSTPSHHVGLYSKLLHDVSKLFT